MMTEEMDRRDFLRLNWKSSIRFLAEVVGPQIKKARDFIRPLGAVDEIEFLSLCTRCNACKMICPTETIALFGHKKGTVLMNTPYMRLNEAPCSFCEKCIEVCPTGALRKSEEAYQPLAKVTVRPSNCVAYQQVMCDYCIRACPIEGALSFPDRKPVVDQEKCTGCGYCVSACIHDPKALVIRPSRAT